MNKPSMVQEIGEASPAEKTMLSRGRYSPWATLFVCLLLLLSTLAVYSPIWRNGFINYDDQDYLTDNKVVQNGLTPPGVEWAFTTMCAGNWHPLTWISHMVDCQIYGMKPGGHHITSLAFHTCNALLLFLLLKSLTGSLFQSGLVAALFAWHPLHVESVAWASERKDVLSTFFFILTLMAYTRFAAAHGARSAEGRHRGSDAVLFYFLSLVLFACGLMSKPMVVTLPFILLLLDYWPLGRMGGGGRDQRSEVRGQKSEDGRQRAEVGGQRTKDGGGGRIARLVLEKVPFMLLSAASSVITLIAQRSTVASMQSLPLDARLENVLASYLLYIQKMLWPAGLSPFYPFHADKPFGLLLLSFIVLFGVSILAVTYGRRLPYLGVGWFWYVGTLVPVIGLVQVGVQSMADRYTYIPFIGLFIATVWGFEALTVGWKNRGVVLIPIVSAVLLSHMFLTWRQAGRWKDSETIFRYALEVTTENAIAHQCLGSVFAEQGKITEAAGHFAEAVRIKPDNYEARNNLGLSLVIKGHLDEAIEQYQWVIKAHPEFKKTHYNLGRAFELQGSLEQAMTCYQKALECDPDFAPAHRSLAVALEKNGQYAKAIEHFEKVLATDPKDMDARFDLATLLTLEHKNQEAERQFKELISLRPGDAESHTRLGLLLAEEGQIEEAQVQFTRAAELRPDEQAFYNLALGYSMMGKKSDAIANYRRALELKPDWPSALNDLAWILATCQNDQLRNGPEAVRLAERACALTLEKEPRFLGTLDAAYAEQGRFADAVATAEKAKSLANARDQRDIAAAAEHRKELYLAGKPYRD